MSVDDEPPAAVDEARFRAELEPTLVNASPSWSARLGRELERERQRRGITARPNLLWVRVGGAVVVGLGLLAIALAQV